MKKILSYCALTVATLGMLPSCSDFLDQESPSTYDSQSVYNSVFNTSMRINKIYSGLMQDRTYSQSMSIVWGLNSDVELVDGLGADATNTGNNRGNMNYNASPAWSEISGVWDACYSIIEDCNLVIEGIRNSDLYNSSGTTGEKNYMGAMLGEALTIRAMVYLDLIRYFGDVPMKFESTKQDLSNAYLGKTDRDEIMDELMDQLDEAIELLPWAYDVVGGVQYTTEHATKGYAHALLAQIALTRAGYAIRESGKSGYETASYSDATYPTQRPDAGTRTTLYQRALTHLSAVITSGRHALNPDFRNEWELLNQLKLDQSYRENIFEIPMGLNVASELGYTVGVRMNGVTTRFGYGNSSGKMKVTAPFFYSFHDGDTRRDVTCSNIQYKEEARPTNEAPEATVTISELLGDNPFSIYVGKWDPRMEGADWLTQNKAMSAKHFTGINCVKMRYSQLLLLYAEVLNELAGPTGSYTGDAGITATEALRQVRARAFTSTAQSSVNEYISKVSTSKESLFEAIVDENAWELAGEGVRKFDLIRWNLLVEKILEFKAQYLDDLASGRYQEKVYYNYTDATNTEVNESSITWFGIPAGKSESDYAGNKSSFGSSKLDDATNKNIYTNLPSISSGLVGAALSPSEINAISVEVKNRYIMPIASTTIAASNGYLKNSYGY